MQDRSYRWAVWIVLAAFAAALVILAGRTEYTIDEPNYLRAGIILRRHLEWEAYSTILHGPVAFLPNQALFFLGSADTAEGSAEAVQAYKQLGRLGLIPFAVLAAWALARFTERALGRVAALGALLSFCLQPLVLGHGCLMTADMALTSFYVLTFYSTWRYLQAPGLARLAAVGFFLGVALATKYLALFAIPALAGIAATAAWCGWRPSLLWSREPQAGRGRRLADLVPVTLVVALVAGLTLHTCYLWTPGGYAVRGPTAEAIPSAEDQTSGPYSGIFVAAVEWPGVPAVLGLLPDPWVRGVDYQKFYSEIGKTQFRDWIGPGFRSYFLVGLGVKLPLAVLCLCLVGLLAREPRWPPHLRAILFWGTLVPFVYLSFFARLQIGVRYILPAVPLLCMLAGRGFAALFQSAKARAAGPAAWPAWAGVALLAWLGAGSALVWPRYIGAFNVLAAGRPYLLYQDSTLDWAIQPRRSPDLAKLRERHPDARVLGGQEGPQLGELLAYGKSLYGVDPRDLGGEKEYRAVHHWLRRFRPVDRVGAWYLFDITVDDFARAVRAGTPEEDERGVTELVTAQLDANGAGDALEILEGSQDPDAELLRQADRAAREDANLYAALLLPLRRPDIVLELDVADNVRAQALLAIERHDDVVGLLRPRFDAGSIQPAECLTLAAAYYKLNEWEDALLVVRSVLPASDEPATDPIQRGLRVLEQRLAAKTLIGSRIGE